MPVIDNQVPMEQVEPELEPDPTFIIDGIAIPANDVEIIFDDGIIDGHVAEEAIANQEIPETEILEPDANANATISNAGDQAQPSRSIRSQNRDINNLIKTVDNNTIIDTSEYCLIIKEYKIWENSISETLFLFHFNYIIFVIVLVMV